MSRHRFFLEAALPGVHGRVALPLSESDVHHAVAVLRIRVGEEIDVVEPAGRVWRVRIEDASAMALVATVAELIPEGAPGSNPHVTLVFGVSKRGKNDIVVEGATEVGISAFLPVLTARSIVKLDIEKSRERGERWRRVALAAAKQSKRATVPEVHDPASFAAVVPLLADYDMVLVAWEEATPQGRGVKAAIASAALEPGARVALVVGPEGGLTADEVAALDGIGGVVVTLGETLLRTETAAVVAGALVLHELGGLGNSA